MNKYKKMKKQVSTDGGQTWQDVIPYVYQKGVLIESDSPDCNNITWVLVDDEYICEQTTEPMSEWRTVSGEYVCTGYDKYTKEAEYRSLDGGSTWTATGNERTGSMIERNSSDCNYPGDTECYTTQGGNMSMGYTSVTDSTGIHYKYDFTDMDNGCYYREADAHTSVNNRTNINYPMPMEWFFPDCTNGVAFGLSILFAVDPEESTFPVSYKYVFGSCDGITQTVSENQTGIGVNQCGTSTMRMSNIAVTQPDYWDCITKISDGVYTFAGVIQKDSTSKAMMRFNFDTVNKTVSNISITVSCLHKQYRRVPVADSFICIETDKYQAVRVYESDDDGETWTDMGIDAGLLIQADSEDCGGSTPSVMTRWVTVPNDYVCVGVDKYNKEKEQESTDGGQTWTDTGNTRAGSTLIEANSYDCGYVSYRWVTVSGEYECVGYDKYNKEKEQRTTDGINWTDTGNTRAGSTLIEANSVDCGYVPTVITRWVTVPNDYQCVGYDKYNKEKEQQSTDGGTTWTDTGNTRAGSTLIEANSEDCGYVPPTPTAKATLTYDNGDVYDIPINGSGVLTQTEVYRDATNYSDPHHHGHITDVVIYNVVTEIGVTAFQACNNQNFTTVSIPDSVTVIDEGAFGGCSYLTNVHLGNHVQTIGYCAFVDCWNLERINIPASLTTIGQDAFHINDTGAISVDRVDIEDLTSWCEINFSWEHANPITTGTVIYINNSPVYNLVIPNEVTSISNYAFHDCNTITSLTVPNSVTSIGGYSFYGCTGLTTADIGSGVTEIGGYAFQYVRTAVFTFRGHTPPSLTNSYSLDVNNNVPMYVPCDAQYAYTHGGYWVSGGTSRFQITGYDCDVNKKAWLTYANGDTVAVEWSSGRKNNLTESEIRQNISSTSDPHYYTNITSAVINNAVAELEIECFYNCTGLTSVTIPEGLTKMNNNALRGCSSLMSIVIPSTVTNIGNYVFLNDSGLNSVTCLRTTPPSLGSSVFNNTNNCPIYVPSTSVAAYKAATNWSTYASRIQAIP